MSSGPTLASCTPIEGLSIGLLVLRCSRWRRRRLPVGLDILWPFVPAAIPAFALIVVFRAFARPVSRFVALVTDSFLASPAPLVEGLDWMMFRNGALVIGVAMFPNADGGALDSRVWHADGHSFLSNAQHPAGVLCMSADVLVGQLLYLHVEVSCFLVLEPNVQEGLLQLLLDRSQGKAKIFIARNASQKKDLDHAQSEVVVILASGCQLICILAK